MRTTYNVAGCHNLCDPGSEKVENFGGKRDKVKESEKNVNMRYFLSQNVKIW